MKEKIRTVRERLSRPAKAAFWLGLIIEIVILIIDKSNYINPIEGQLFRVTFVLFVLKMLCTDYDRNDLLYIGIFAVLGFISWRVTGRNEILRETAFVAACRGIDMRKILKVLFFGTGIGSMFLIFLSVTGIYGGISVTANFDGYVTTRYCFGMGNPNSFEIMIGMITLLGLFVYTDRVKIWHLFCLFILDGILFYLSRSIMGAGVMTAAILWTLVLKLAGRNAGRRTHGTGRFIFWELVSAAAMAFGFYGAVYDNGIVKLLDDTIFTGRFASLRGFNRHDGMLSTWHLFGSRLNEKYFDLGWVRLVYWYGVIPAAAILAVLFVMFAVARKRQDDWALMMLTILTVFTVMEAHIVSQYIARNYLLVLASAMLPQADLAGYITGRNSDQ